MSNTLYGREASESGEEHVRSEDCPLCNPARRSPGVPARCSHGDDYPCYEDLKTRAEKAEAEVERLRKALRGVEEAESFCKCDEEGDHADGCPILIAREALEGK